MDAVVAVIGLVGSAIVAGIGAYAGTRHRIRAELEAEYDSDLRKSRIAVYQSLWSALEPLAKYSREEPGYPTHDQLRSLSAALRKWYFETGGIYLSAESRQAYFDVQEGLAVVVGSERWADVKGSKQVDADTFEALRQLGSWLRTTLTYDVGTRRRFSLAPDWQPQDKAANDQAVREDLAAKDRSVELKENLQDRW
jgi:hypothetical protein